MSDYIRDIQFDLIVPKAKVLSHKQALLSIGQHAADFLNISEKTMCKRLMDKEEVSASPIGNGVAIPQLKMRRVQTPFTMLMTLDRHVSADSPDTEPLDLYCLLISPMDDGPVHLRRLSRISRLLQNATLRKRLRETQDRDIMQALLIDPEGWLLAA